MSTAEASETQARKKVKYRTRRRHQKSRNGCFECKRRKVKCDEVKASCTRCVLTLQKCIYPSAPSAADEPKDQLSLPSPPCSILSPLSNAPSFQSSTRSTPLTVESKLCINPADFSLPVSDTDLYHHYLQHTSRTLTHHQRDQVALQIGMPTLALQSKTVFHSLLAVSATCLCCDIISKEPSPDPNTVNQILATAYQHYNLASERMRELMSQPRDALKTEPLLASNILLVPFATASQQINHWISKQSRTNKSLKLLSTTPRDVIVIMRGVRTMLRALDYDDVSSNVATPPKIDFATDSPSWLLEISPSPPTPPPSRTHVMFPILATTSPGAFSKLRERLEFISPSESGISSSLAACATAFEVLNNIRINTFCPSNNMAPQSHESKDVSLPQTAAWLSSYACRPAISLPTEPLTRYFLTFLVQTSQSFIDLVLPLLDQRLESPVSTSSSEDTSTDLTRDQALALDIYAHWSVLMFLVEEESYWIGTLPVVTLTGMLNRYGDDFVSRLWPEDSYEKGLWWPGTMLNILREIKRCQ